MESTEKSKSSYYSLSGIDSQVTHHVVAMENVAEQHVFINTVNVIIFKL